MLEIQFIYNFNHLLVNTYQTKGVFKLVLLAKNHLHTIYSRTIETFFRKNLTMRRVFINCIVRSLMVKIITLTTFSITFYKA